MSSIEAYLKALVANDSSTLLVAPNLKATEGAKPSDLKSGLWSKATKIGSYAFTVSDKETRQQGFVGLIWRGEDASIVAIRIKINLNEEIEESEIIVGLDRFPGETSTDPKTLTKFREEFTAIIPKDRRMSRQEIRDVAASYYDGFNNFDPAKVHLTDTGNRVENGTQCTNTSKFLMADGFYETEDPNLKLPNFAEWSAKEQFNRGLYTADTVVVDRYPLIDTETGVAMTYGLYYPWTKATAIDVKGVGKIRPVGGPDNMGAVLCMMEMFRIKDGQIFDIESVWFAGSPPMSTTGW